MPLPPGAEKQSQAVGACPQPHHPSWSPGAGNMASLSSLLAPQLLPTYGETWDPALPTVRNASRCTTSRPRVVSRLVQCPPFTPPPRPPPSALLLHHLGQRHGGEKPPLHLLSMVSCVTVGKDIPPPSPCLKASPAHMIQWWRSHGPPLQSSPCPSTPHP